MCFFYALSKDAQSIKNRYQIQFDFEFDPVYYTSGFDYPRMPVITHDKPGSIQQMQWGLIPPWVKTAEEAAKMRSYTLNARHDSLFTKPSFRNTIRKKRCLIPASGFYEWREFAGKKYPYFIYLKDTDLFSFAGLWEDWLDKSTGEVVSTYSIITTDANPLMEKIHNTKKRMPVILPAAAEETWLRSGLGDAAIQGLTRPFDAGLMAAHTIGRLITSRGADRNTRAIQDAYAYPELEAL